MRTDRAELLRIHARIVVNNAAFARGVDQLELAWAYEILSQNPDDAPSRAHFDEVQQLGEYFDRLEAT